MLLCTPGRGHVLVGCKSPVREPPSTLWTTRMTSLRQGRLREGSSEGSPRQSCEPRNTNVIEGRLPWGEAAPRVEALWFGGIRQWRGCAATVHALVRGDLLDERSAVMGAGLRPRSKGLDWPPDPKAAPVMGAGLRPRSKGLDWPPDPKATLAARLGALGVIEQKSAEGIVGILPRRVRMLKARTL